MLNGTLTIYSKKIFEIILCKIQNKYIILFAHQDGIQIITTEQLSLFVSHIKIVKIC